MRTFGVSESWQGKPTIHRTSSLHAASTRPALSAHKYVFPSATIALKVSPPSQERPQPPIQSIFQTTTTSVSLPLQQPSVEKISYKNQKLKKKQIKKGGRTGAQSVALSHLQASEKGRKKKTNKNFLRCIGGVHSHHTTFHPPHTHKKREAKFRRVTKEETMGRGVGKEGRREGGGKGQ